MMIKRIHISRMGLPRPRSGALLCGLAAMALSTSMQAQVAGYSASWSNDSTYTPISGGLVLADGRESAVTGSGATGQFHPNNGTYSGIGLFVDPVNFPNGEGVLGINQVRTGPGYDIGFDFEFNGDVFDRIGISAYGWISFGKSADGSGAVSVFHSTTNNAQYWPLSNTLAPMEGTYRRNRVVGFAQAGGGNTFGGSFLPYTWNALYGTEPGSSLRIETIGAPGDRICVVQWDRYMVRGTAGNPQNPAFARLHSFQIRLYENGNKVEVRFGPTTPTGSQAANHQVGIGGRTGGTSPTAPAPGADYLGYGALNSSTWASPALLTTSPRSGFATSSSNFPPEGRSFVFAPPPCPQVASGPVLSNVDTSSVTFGWTGSGDFNYVISPTNDPSDVNAVSGNTSSNSVNVTGLTPGTQYWAFVRTDCGLDGPSDWTAAVSFRTWSVAPCGENWYDPGGSGGNVPSTQYDEVTVICPDDPGNVVTVDFADVFSIQTSVVENGVLFIRDGYGLSAPLVSGDGIGYTGGTPSMTIPAGGWITQPPIVTSTAPSGCLTFRFMQAIGGWPGTGWDAEVICAPPPTCPPPTNTTLVNPNPDGGSFSWTSEALADEYEWVVVGPSDGPTATPLAQGSTNATSVVVSGLNGAASYRFYVRSSCDSGGDIGPWLSPAVPFTTLAGCGGPLDLFYAPSFSLPELNTLNGDSVVTICPNSVGDVVTVAFSQLRFSWQGANNSLYVYDGPDVNAPQIMSGLNNLAATMPPGGFHGNGTYSTTPPTFTSTHPGGCLTFRVRSFGANSFDLGALGAVTCAPVPDCATPHDVSVSNVGQTTATISWSGAASSIIEYGPVGFTPGTGATAGVDGTVISAVSSPYEITGLTATTQYDVYVRQVCAGPTYSPNAWWVRLATSLDCSTAQVITCGELVPNVFTATAGNANYVAANYDNASCMGSAIAQATGAERLFRFSVTTAGEHQFNIPSNSLSSTSAYAIAPVSEGCAPGAFTCVGNVAANSTAQHVVDLAVGDYYAILETNSSANGTQSFQVYCQGVPACVPTPTYPRNNVSVALNTTPIPFAWPASFGATGYDIYVNDVMVVENHPTNSITSGAYTPQTIATAVGIGNAFNWRVEPRNSFGIAECSTNWSFIVGGNGAANAITLQEGVAKGGTCRLDHGYANDRASYSGLSNFTANGYDVHYAFTAGPCATSMTATMNVPQSGWASTGTPSQLRLTLINAGTGLHEGTTTNSPGFISSIQPLRTLTANVSPGTTYYLVVDNPNTALQYQFDFTISYAETEDLATDSDGDGTPDCLDECPFDPDKIEEGICGCFVPDTDTDGDGIPDCLDSCPSLAGEIGDPCTPNILYLNGVINASCECEGVDLAPCTNQVTLELNTGANGEEATWELLHNGGVILSGGGVGYPNDAIVTEFFCLPDACYTLRVYDSAGDGLTGYVLRKSGVNGDRIIDNVGNFSGSGLSAIGSGPSAICFPMDPDPKPLFHLRDKVDFVSGSYLISEEVAAVSAQWQVGNQTDDGYEFWIFDPNGSYSYRRFRNHATSDGFANVGATRACHMRVNGWFASQHAPADVLLNVRIRTRVNGANSAWGPAFRFKIDPARAACPLTKLNDFVGNQFESCNKARNWGSGNWIHARPVPSANRYQWRFRTGDGFDRTVTTNTYFLQLNWASQPLVPGATYDVEVRASKNGGVSYCTNATVDLPELEVWGDICTLTINSSNAQGGGEQLGLEGNANKVTMYPNPNRGDQLWLNIDVIEEGVEMITVDFFDLAGHRTVARMIPTQGDRLQTVLDFQGQLAAGVYIVHITAGEKVYTERLVITQ